MLQLLPSKFFIVISFIINPLMSIVTAYPTDSQKSSTLSKTSKISLVKTVLSVVILKANY